ncbi:MAG TPA: TIR domain-containing protein [Bradyrhizobium sp.]|nr:TIR domain-containing protein [Bradyrhizobium sp.]
MQFDFFVAHASEDKNPAEDLAWELERLERAAFVDAANIRAGSRWDEELTLALAQSRIIVVLISQHTKDSYYQREEIARAIEKVRDNPDCKVVPVLLPGATRTDLPFGLRRVQAIDAGYSGGMKGVAKALNDQFPADTAKNTLARRNAYYTLGAALRLDRIKQWQELLEATHIAQNTLFLFHGPHDQNVGLFLERIQRFFSQGVANAYGIYRVPFNIQGQTPRTGSDWLAHLRDALNCRGEIAPQLRQMVQKQPLFIMLGQSPLAVDQLKDQHIEALREFITDHLIELLREARLSRGISIMLALDYAKINPDLIAKFEAWGRQAEESGLLRFRTLPEASLPSWEEVNDYLQGMKPRPDADQVALIRREYDRYASNPDLTFERLARLIDRYTLTS